MKRILSFIVILAVIAFIVCLVPLPKKIDDTFSGVIWEDGNEELTEECMVLVEGRYYCYLVNLVKENVFKGNISISYANETKKYELMDVKLVKSRSLSGRNGMMNYYNAEANHTEVLGDITVSKNFDSLVIDFSSDGRMLSAPAKDRKEAVELALELKNTDFNYK